MILETMTTAGADGNSGDYTGADGLLMCGKCNTPKQFLLPPPIAQIVPCLCECEMRKLDAERAQMQERERKHIAELNAKAAYGYPGERFDGLERCRFERDDMQNPQQSKICKAYAERFKPDIKWLVLYGDTDAGKSFHAACITNKLLDDGKRVRFVTASQVAKALWNAENKQEIYADLFGSDLMVLDDLGAERDTEYMNEVIFDIIDGRLRSAKPMLITTNLTPGELMKAGEIKKQRIYSRIIEKSAFLNCRQLNRRKAGCKEESQRFFEELMADV